MIHEKPSGIKAFCEQVLQKCQDNKIAIRTIKALELNVKGTEDLSNNKEFKRLIELEKKEK